MGGAGGIIGNLDMNGYNITNVSYVNAQNINVTGNLTIAGQTLAGGNIATRTDIEFLRNAASGASITGTGNAVNANDGSFSTKTDTVSIWCNGYPSCSASTVIVIIDFKKIEKLVKLKVKWEGYESRSGGSLSIESSTDGSSWTGQGGRGLSGTNTVYTDEFIVSSIQAKFLRVMAYYSHSNTYTNTATYGAVYEIEAYRW